METLSTEWKVSREAGMLDDISELRTFVGIVGAGSLSAAARKMELALPSTPSFLVPGDVNMIGVDRGMSRSCKEAFVPSVRIEFRLGNLDRLKRENCRD
jgi:hypothetical protein